MDVPFRLVNFLLRFIIYYVYSILLACMLAGQKRAPDPITDLINSQHPPLEEQQPVLLTSESSL